MTQFFKLHDSRKMITQFPADERILLPTALTPAKAFNSRLESVQAATDSVSLR